MKENDEAMADYYEEIEIERERKSKKVVTLEVEASAKLYIPINVDTNQEEYLEYISNVSNEDKKNPECYILYQFKKSNKSTEELFNLFNCFEKMDYSDVSRIKYDEFYYHGLSIKDEQLDDKLINFEDLEESDMVDNYQELTTGIERKGESNLYFLLFMIKAKVKSTIYTLLNINDPDYQDYENKLYSDDSLPSPMEFIRNKIELNRYFNISVLNRGYKNYENFSEIELIAEYPQSSNVLHIDFNQILND